LQYIHNQNLFHRDISPDNIIQPKDPIKPAVLIDFGVVGYLEGGTSVGKMGYAPPEQMGGGQCLPSSDIYSLAVTAIELLTGKTPDLLFDSNYLKWKWQKYTTVSNTLANILNKMLETRPGNRYSSAIEVLNAINSLNNDSGFTNKLFTGISTGIFLVAATMISGYIPIICNGLNNCHSDKKKNDIEIITDQKPTPNPQFTEKPFVSPNSTTLSSCEEDPNKCEKPNPKTLDKSTPKTAINNEEKPVKRNVEKIPSCQDIYFGNCLEDDKPTNKKNTKADKQVVNTNSKSNNKSQLKDNNDRTKS
jgi:serine/threonine protein kinase